MPIETDQYHNGIFLNPDAMDARTKKYLAKMLRNVLAEATESAIAPSLFVNNPLPAEHGTVGKLYDWGQVVAMLKQDAVPTGVQHIKPTDHTYELDQYEVKVGITGKAKINSQMEAQDILTEGNAARAFQRAFDAQAFNHCKADMNTTSVGTGWASATDAEVLEDIDDMLGEIDDKQFMANAAVFTRKQWTRIGVIGMNYANVLTAEQLIKNKWPDVQNIYIWRKIQVKMPDGTWLELFNPEGYCMALQTNACGVYTQKPTTVEFVRDAFADVDFGLMRKYFKTDLVQKDAGHMLDNIGI